MRRQCLNGISVVLLFTGLSLGAGGRDVPLVEAVKSGDVEAVRALAQPDTVNRPTPDGTTALHWAAYRGDVDVAEVLIRAGADVTLMNRYGVMPLALACRAGNAPVIEQLLHAGADPNSTLPEGETVLMAAAQAGSAAGVRLLLAQGAHVNAREETEDQTALMWAAARNRVDAIHALLEGGADLNATARRRPEAADLAAAIDRGNERNSYYVPFVEGFTPLLYAVREGHMEAARALLAAGANANDSLSDGMSALVVAIKNHHWELGDVLLEYGADPNAAAQGWAALHELAYQRLLSVGTLPHPVDTGNLTAVELAVQLVAHGADVNARMTKDMVDGYRHVFRREGATPLVLAAKAIDAGLIQTLLGHGADPTLTTAAGTTPLMVAAGLEMQNPGEDSGTNEDALDAVAALVEAGVDVNVVNAAGDTALHGAARRGANAIVQFLVDHAAKLGAQNERGLLPMNIADGLAPDGKTLFLGGVGMPMTASLIRQLMTARGLPVSPPPAGIFQRDVEVPGNSQPALAPLPR